MAEVSEIDAGGEVRIIKDATARQGVENNANTIATMKQQLGRGFSTTITNQTFPARETKTIQISFPDLPKGRYLMFMMLANNNNTTGHVYEYTGFFGFFDFNWSASKQITNANVILHNGGTFNYAAEFQQFDDTDVTGVSITATLIQVGFVD